MLRINKSVKNEQEQRYDDARIFTISPVAWVHKIPKLSKYGSHNKL